MTSDEVELDGHAHAIATAAAASLSEAEIAMVNGITPSNDLFSSPLSSPTNYRSQHYVGGRQYSLGSAARNSGPSLRVPAYDHATSSRYEDGNITQGQNGIGPLDFARYIPGYPPANGYQLAPAFPSSASVRSDLTAHAGFSGGYLTPPNTARYQGQYPFSLPVSHFRCPLYTTHGPEGHEGGFVASASQLQGTAQSGYPVDSRDLHVRRPESEDSFMGVVLREPSAEHDEGVKENHFGATKKGYMDTVSPRTPPRRGSAGRHQTQNRSHQSSYPSSTSLLNSRPARSIHGSATRNGTPNHFPSNAGQRGDMGVTRNSKHRHGAKKRRANKPHRVAVEPEATLGTPSTIHGRTI